MIDRLRDRLSALFQEHSYAVAEKRYGKPGDWADRAIAIYDDQNEIDSEPCDSEIWSWDYFRHGQVDPYWIRCGRIGPHDRHEDSNTGATWTDKDAA